MLFLLFFGWWCCLLLLFLLLFLNVGFRFFLVDVSFLYAKNWQVLHTVTLTLFAFALLLVGLCCFLFLEYYYAPSSCGNSLFVELSVVYYSLKCEGTRGFSGQNEKSSSTIVIETCACVFCVDLCELGKNCILYLSLVKE